MKALALTVQGPDGPVTIVPPSGFPGSGGEITINQVLSFAVNFIFFGGIILALIFLLWGGMSWILSGGEKEKIEKARKTMVYAIVGLIVLVLAFFIINFVGSLLGIDFLSNLGKSSAPPVSHCPVGAVNCKY